MDLSTRDAFLIAYDISDPKRLVKTRKVLLGFGDPVQLSVFYCELTPREVVELKNKIADVINAKEDRVLFANLGPAGGRGAEAITTIGRAHETTIHQAIVV